MHFGVLHNCFEKILILLMLLKHFKTANEHKKINHSVDFLFFMRQII